MKKVQLAIFDFNGVLEKNGEMNRELLDWISTLPIKTAVLTAADFTTVKIMLKGARIDPFDEYFTPDTMLYRKPSTQAFHEVARAMDLLPEECVMIDDVKMNVKAAEKAGMHAALYIGNTQLETVFKRLQIL